MIHCCYNVVWREVGHVDVGQSGETCKDEKVSHHLQSRNAQILVGYSEDLLVRQEASIYWLHMEMVILKRLVF